VYPAKTGVLSNSSTALARAVRHESVEAALLCERSYLSNARRVKSRQNLRNLKPQILKRSAQLMIEQARCQEGATGPIAAEPSRYPEDMNFVDSGSALAPAPLRKRR
jgi:hypothetical protein